MAYPKLRHIDVFPVETENGQMVALRDPNGIATEMLIISPDILYILRYFDGRHSLEEVQEEYRLAFGKKLEDAQLQQVVDHLDTYFFLDNQTYATKRKQVEQEFLQLPARPAVHAGQSYEADAIALSEQLNSFFTDPMGAGLPEHNGKARRTLKGLVAPHIDIRAGGPCYTHAYRALAESEAVDCFVILGTGHSGLANLYSTLPKDFDTPLGPVKHDAGFIDLLRENYPDIEKSEALPHKSEHVIEFQLVFLKHLYGQRNFTFVPILCSFSYHMLTDPRFSRERETVETFSRALRQTIGQYAGKVCLIASVDFSHVGLRYGDQSPPDATFLSRVNQFDKTLIQHIERLDAEAFCKTVAQQQDRYRVCGFSSIYTMLNALDAQEGRLLDYADTEVDNQNSRVTFASMAFH